MKLQFYLIFVGILLFACSSNEKSEENTTLSSELLLDREVDSTNILDTILVNGFDFPVGNREGKGKYTSKTDGKEYDSWYIASKFAESYSLGIHTGVDYNGTGGGNTDLGQPVYSIGKGIVIESENFGSPWGNVVLIKHWYLENGKISICFSLYAHLDEILVRKGDFVNKREPLGGIGTGGGSYPAHLHLEIRKGNMEEFEATYWPSSNGKDVAWLKDHYEDPSEFICSHRALTCPYTEDRVIIAVKNTYRLYYYEKGILKNEYEIALSQNPIGPKEKEGDLKMPEGEYYITGKQKGPFAGNFAEFLGNELIRISYPNIFDANIAFKKGRISKKIRDDIVTANEKRTTPPQSTVLGGGIVIHGWNGDWVANGEQNLTWGCISMHNSDLDVFYDIVQLKTKIIILP